MSIFLKAYEIESVFYVHAQLGFEFFRLPGQKEKINIKIVLKPFLILINGPEAAS